MNGNEAYADAYLTFDVLIAASLVSDYSIPVNDTVLEPVIEDQLPEPETNSTAEVVEQISEEEIVFKFVYDWYKNQTQTQASKPVVAKI